MILLSHIPIPQMLPNYQGEEDLEDFSFCDWVKSFEIDEFEDEWGLY